MQDCGTSSALAMGVQLSYTLQATCSVKYETVFCAHCIQRAIKEFSHAWCLSVRMCVFMPPPLGAGGIMFSDCLSVRPSVRPKPEIPSFDLYMGPLVHPTNRNRFTAGPSVRPSGEVSGHLLENARKEWPEILRTDVSWPPPELISLWPRSVDFSNFGAILT